MPAIDSAAGTDYRRPVHDRLDPQTLPILEALAAAPSLHTAPLEEGRSSYDAMRKLGFAPQEESDATDDFEIPGPGGSIRARLYGAETTDGGLLIHVHSGGYVAGSIDGYDPESRAFAKRGGCRVLTFDYRLAPAHPFPAGVEDAFAVLTWATANASDRGCRADKIAIGGDSAGANLAAVTAIRARDASLPLELQMLIYPNTDYGRSHPSTAEFAQVAALTRDGVDWARSQHLGERGDPLDWRASPLLAESLAGVAPALVVTGECDAFRDEGEACAARLANEGVPTIHRRYEGMPHGFFSTGAFVDTARRAVVETCDTLRERLG